MSGIFWKTAKQKEVDKNTILNKSVCLTKKLSYNSDSDLSLMKFSKKKKKEIDK